MTAIETFEFDGANVPVIGYGELQRSKSDILSWNIAIKAGMENATAYTFVSLEDATYGAVVRHGVCASFKARMNTFTVRTSQKLHGDLLPYVGKVVALATVANDKGGSNDALRASMAAAYAAPGNVKPRNATVLDRAAIQNVAGQIAADFGDDGELPDAAVTAAGVVVALGDSDGEAPAEDAAPVAKVRKARKPRKASNGN